jgi:hypothetical protein
MTVDRMLTLIVENSERDFARLAPSQAASERAELKQLQRMVVAAKGTSNEADMRPILVTMVNDIISANVAKMKQFNELERSMAQIEAVAEGKVEAAPESEEKLAPNMRSTIPKAFDGAAKLTPWTRGKPVMTVFAEQFSFHEKSRSRRELGADEEREQDPNFDVRETMGAIAQGLDTHGGRLYALQTSTQEMGVFMRIVGT